MRTTLTLDDDVALELRTRAKLTGTSFKQLVNDAIRAGLQAGKRPGSAPEPFEVTPMPAGFRAGVDVLRLNQLNDDLQTEVFNDQLRRVVTRG